MFGFYSFGRYAWWGPCYWALIVLGIIEDAADYFLDLAATISTIPPWGSLLAIEARARAIDK